MSNDGIVICCDWLNWTELSGYFKIFDSFGEELISIKTKANLGNNSISLDSKITLVETHNSDNEDGDKIYLFDIPNRNLIAKFDRPTSFVKAKINSSQKRIVFVDKKNFEYEIDFEGNQTNSESYYNQIINKGDADDILSYFYGLTKETKLKDENYLNALIEITEKQDNRSGLAMIYREIGEFYEFSGEMDKTIEYWTKAIALNSKCGVKRRLNKLRRKNNCCQQCQT